MKKKIIGIFVMMLLISSTSLSLTVNSKNLTNITEKSQSEFIENELILFEQEIKIINPENALYVFDQKLFPFFTAVSFGLITVEATVTGGQADKVEFYVDDVLKYVDFTEPYNWKWHEKTFSMRNLKVVAYSGEEEVNDEINIIRFDLGPTGVTRENAIDILINQVIKPLETDNKIVFGLSDTLQEGDKIAPWLPTPLSENIDECPYLIYRHIENPTWFFWIDNDPKAEFAHPNTFVFIDAQNGNIVTTNEEWWPVLNDESLWIEYEEYWDIDNWAFCYFETPFNLSQTSSLEELESTDCLTLEGDVGAVVISGSGGYFEDNADKMAEAFGDKGYDVEKRKPPNNNIEDFEDAIKKLADKGKKDIIIYISSHGSPTPTIVMGNKNLRKEKFIEILNNYSHVTFKIIIQSCFSGAWIPILKECPNVITIYTSCKKDEHSHSAKPDYAHHPTCYEDPNKNEEYEGSEYTTGLYQGIKEQSQGTPDLELLKKAHKRACDLDECLHHPGLAGNQRQHPQSWERLDVIKWVWNETSSKWEKDFKTEVCKTIKFKLEIFNNGEDWQSLFDIWVIDNLPANLDYKNKAKMDGEPREPDSITTKPDGSTELRWFIPELEGSKKTEITFEAHVKAEGNTKNLLYADGRTVTSPVEPNVYDRDNVSIRTSDDIIPPDIKIIYPLDESNIYYPIIDVTGFANDSETGVVHLDYLWEWDGGSRSDYNECDAGECYVWKFIITLINIAPGWNRFTMTAVDAIGNTAVKSITFYYITDTDKIIQNYPYAKFQCNCVTIE